MKELQKKKFHISFGGFGPHTFNCWCCNVNIYNFEVKRPSRVWFWSKILLKPVLKMIKIECIFQPLGHTKVINTCLY